MKIILNSPPFRLNLITIIFVSEREQRRKPNRNACVSSAITRSREKQGICGVDCQWCQPRANKDEGNKSTGFEEISLEVFIQADVSVFDHKTNRIRERENYRCSKIR